jgi:hypothetical protein
MSNSAVGVLEVFGSRGQWFSLDACCSIRLLIGLVAGSSLARDELISCSILSLNSVKRPRG